MSSFDMLILDYANFSNNSVDITMIAIKLSKTTREIKYLRKTDPWKYEKYLNQYQKESNSIKSIEYPPLPSNWFQHFTHSGGLTMINGECLPTLENLKNAQDVF